MAEQDRASGGRAPSADALAAGEPEDLVYALGTRFAAHVDAADAALAGAMADLLDRERLVPNLHRAYAEAAGAEEGAVLDVATMFGELVEYHGSLPACHA